MAVSCRENWDCGTVRDNFSSARCPRSMLTLAPQSTNPTTDIHSRKNGCRLFGRDEYCSIERCAAPSLPTNGSLAFTNKTAHGFLAYKKFTNKAVHADNMTGWLHMDNPAIVSSERPTLNWWLAVGVIYADASERKLRAPAPF